MVFFFIFYLNSAVKLNFINDNEKLCTNIVWKSP